jgi:hypothetical protein
MLCARALAQDYCDQPFAPLRPGWEWQYRSVDEANKPSGSYSLRKVLKGQNSYIQQQRGKNEKGQDQNFDLEYLCQAEGIRSSEKSVIENFSRGDGVKIRSAKLSGYEVPDYDKWEVGQGWKQTTELEGEGNIGPLRVSGRMISDTTYKVVGQETIMVGAGKFNAIKVELSISFKVVAAIPVPFGNQTITGTAWYAEDVGMVKRITVFNGGKDKTITELVALKKGK